MRKDAILISGRFKLPNWKPFEEMPSSDGQAAVDEVWIYKRP